MGGPHDPDRPDPADSDTSIRKRREWESNEITTRNYVDDQGNPAGGYAHGVGMCISWQDGPRGPNPDGGLNPPNGAFVEDVMLAAKQRLEFFQQSQYADEANEMAIVHLNEAMEALHKRAEARRARGVLGQNVK